MFGNLFHRKKEIRARLEGVQRSLGWQQNRSLIKLEVKLHRDLDKVLDQIDTFWFQKVRTKAIRDGDCNTQYYHLSTRGVRQGDPLWPYIFVLCIERLNHIIEEAVANEEWKLVFVSKNGPHLSNLFFTDDLILFGEASSAQASVINGCLNRFCEASGKKVSLTSQFVHFSNNVNP